MLRVDRMLIISAIAALLLTACQPIMPQEVLQSPEMQDFASTPQNMPSMAPSGLATSPWSSVKELITHWTLVFGIQRSIRMEPKRKLPIPCCSRYLQSYLTHRW